MLTRAEENYLKSIFHLERELQTEVNTSSIAEAMETKPSSATDMIQRLAEKKLVNYRPYKGVQLTAKGRKLAANVIRKHRLWEVFLVEKLNFQWDEVHEIAEQLEHIQSDELISRLAEFLGNPELDPHGDPIPDEEGVFKKTEKKLLSETKPNEIGICVGVQESGADFLQYLDRLGIQIGTRIKMISKENFDNSVIIEIDSTTLSLSGKVAENLFLKII